MPDVPGSAEWDTVIITKAAKKGSPQVECIFCHKTYSATATRIRAHVLSTKGGGVTGCQSVPPNVVATLRAKAEAQDKAKLDFERKRKLDSFMKQPTMPEAISTNKKAKADKAVTRLFVGEGIAFRKCESDLLKVMCKAVAEAGAGYSFPTRQALSTNLLEVEYTELKAIVESNLKGRVGTLTTDGWKSNASRNIVNVMLSTSEDISVFISCSDVTGERKTGGP